MLTFENLPIVSYTRYLLYIYVKSLLRLQAKNQILFVQIIEYFLKTKMHIFFFALTGPFSFRVTEYSHEQNI
mgnify:CR=1 FL=1